MKKLICIVLTLLLFSSFNSIVIGNKASNEQNTDLLGNIKQNIKAINKDIIGQASLASNVLISDNTENDYHPKITVTSHNQIIVVYEQYIDMFSTQVPVVFSTDGGSTWTMAYLFDSIGFIDGSGTLKYPDIVYNAPNDLLYLTMTDPYAEMYNNEMSLIPGDIESGGDASWFGLSGIDSKNYNYAAAACTNNFFISLTTEDNYGMEQIFRYGYFTSPDFKFPPTMVGYYYDGGSEHQSSPVAEPEMATNANRIFIVCESNLDDGTKITIKSSVNDEALLTNGEQQHEMDKYADIEQYPGEYLGDGTDPDVSGSGNKVAVVYVQDGAVKCSYSTCDAGTYEPGFNWQVSTVETGASAPAVFMQGNTVFCAYVKDGNLYVKKSEDAGATWAAARQMNDEQGTVIAEKGAVAIGVSGIVFTDNRNENYDIFFVALPEANNPPTNPTCTYSKKELTVSSIDADGDQIRYGVSWDNDYTVDEWTILSNSGTSVTIDCTDKEGKVGVIAEDANGAQSGWVSVTPKNKSVGYHSLLLDLLTVIYKILQQKLQL